MGRRTRRKRGACQPCHYPAFPSADDSGDDDLVTASACPRSSQSSQDIAGVTAGGEALRLLWLIWASWSIRGAGGHSIHRRTRINHGNVTEAADGRVAAPSPRLIAHRPRGAGTTAHQPGNQGPPHRTPRTRRTTIFSERSPGYRERTFMVWGPRNEMLGWKVKCWPGASRR